MASAGSRSAQARGDLPANVTTQDYCGGSLGAPEVHGTAVAENVYDVAPAASLYLVCITTEVTLANAVSYVKAQGVDIVVHSIGWFNTSRGDGTGAAGTPDALVADARANGILWVNAAGNEAQSHWRGPFYDPGADDFLDFATNDELNEFIVGAGKTACVAMRWDAWPTTTEDYDLYIFRSADMSAPYAGSVHEQNPGEPTEETCFTNSTGTTQSFGFAIHKFAGTAATPVIDVFVLDASDIERPMSGASVVEPATSPAAIAVGAVCWSHMRWQVFSSTGPTIDGRIKPDIVAPSGTSSGVYGAAGDCDADGFVGTSASAPHVAGLAALLKAGDPSLTVSQLEAALLTDAIDVDEKGADNKNGAGLAWLPATAVGAAANGGRISFARGHAQLPRPLDERSRRRQRGQRHPRLPVRRGHLVTGRPTARSSHSTTACPTSPTPTAPTPAELDVSGGLPQWSHDGSRIATLSGGRLSISPAVGGIAVDLGSQFWATSGVSWSLDDSKLYGVYGGDVVTVDADGSNRTPVAITAPNEESIALSPDGTKIAYSARSGGGGSDFRIYVIDSTMTGTPVELTTDPTRDENWPRWSPDGTTILYTSYLPDCCTKAETWRVGATGTPAPQRGHDRDGIGVVRGLAAARRSDPTGAAVHRRSADGGPDGDGADELRGLGPGELLLHLVALHRTWSRMRREARDDGGLPGRHGRRRGRSPSRREGYERRGHDVSCVAALARRRSCSGASASASAGGGGGGGGGGGAGPDVEVSLSASNATPAPNEVIEVRRPCSTSPRPQPAAGSAPRSCCPSA